MSETQKRAMTMREIREGLGHVRPAHPDVIVSISRYTISVLPSNDINHKYFSLYVELKPSGWILHSGHEYYATDGTWQPSESLAQRFADYDEALAIARQAAPGLTVNGRTATEAYQRTQVTDA